MGTRVTTEYHLAMQRLKFSPSDTWHPSGERGYSVTQSVTSGPAIHDWKYKISHGIQATTPLEAVGQKLTVVNNGFALHWAIFGNDQNNFNYTAQMGCITRIDVVPPDPSAVFILSVQNQVRMDMVAKIRQAHTMLKGLVTLGELGESVRQVNGAGKALCRGLSNYLSDVSYMTKGRRFTPQNIMRNIGSKWLEYAFGWRPLIADIDDGMKAFDRYQRTRPPSVEVSSSRLSTEKTPAASMNFTYARHAIKLTPVLEKLYGYKIYGRVGITNTGMGSLAHNFGLKLDEFVPTAWELIPFSFLADYFVNIGAVVDALSLNTSSIRWLNYGELRQGSVESSPAYLGYQALSSPWQVKEKSFEFGTPFRHVRYIKYRNGLPGYSYLIPSTQFSIPGSSTKWLNMSALATQNTDTIRQLRAFRGR
jgi:hypothetical protein